MNIIYEYMPKRTTKKEIALIAILLGAAVGFFTVPTIFKDMQIAWLFQGSALVCLCGVIFLYTEFFAKNIVYRLVEDEDGKILFTVTELMSGGKKSLTVCCVALECVEQVKVFDNLSEADVKRKKEFARAAKKEKRRRFSFYPEMAPCEICSFLAEENEEKLLVNIVAVKDPVQAVGTEWLSHTDIVFLLFTEIVE